MAECAAARHAGVISQPRPRLSRCHHEPHALPAAGAVADLRPALHPGAAALDEIDAADERRYQRDIKTAEQLRQQAAKLNNIGINSGSDLCC